MSEAAGRRRRLSSCLSSHDFIVQFDLSHLYIRHISSWLCWSFSQRNRNARMIPAGLLVHGFVTDNSLCPTSVTLSGFTAEICWLKVTVKLDRCCESPKTFDQEQSQKQQRWNQTDEAANFTLEALMELVQNLKLKWILWAGIISPLLCDFSAVWTV